MALSAAAVGGDTQSTGVCAPRGFVAGAAAADIRGHGDDGRLDVAIVRSERPCQAAGVFTRNRVKAAPVVISQLTLRQGRVQAVLLNSGNANACTGAQGFRDALQMIKAAGDACDLDPAQVLVCSTGVIGRPMPMSQVVAGVRGAVAAMRPGGGDDLARAIMTTDTVPKQAVRRIEIEGRTVVVGGVAKGSGMIHPDMATLLALVTTDALVADGVLGPLLRRVTDQTFNCVTVDGDTSTNDALILAATGQGVAANTRRDLLKLEVAVGEVARQLAQAIVRDGEGATKFVTIEVERGRNAEECRQVAYAVAHSPLVKTAFFASDPNLGRILAAIGNSGVRGLDTASVDLHIDEVRVVHRGARDAAYREELGVAAMKKPEFKVRAVLNRGKAQATVWTCDLSFDYVKINAEYRT